MQEARRQPAVEELGDEVAREEVLAMP